LDSLKLWYKVFYTISFLFVFVFTYQIQGDTLFFDNFDDGTDSRWNKPDGGDWTVENGEYHRGLGTYPITDFHYISYVGYNSWENYSVACDIKVIEDIPGGWGVLCFRIQDSANYYTIQFEPSTDAFHFDHITNSSCTPFVRANFPTELNVWYRIKVTVEGDSIFCYINDSLLISIQDSLYHTGSAGLAAWHAHSHFDNFLVSGSIPKIFSIMPDSGKCNGGNVVTLNGLYFTQNIAVFFGSAPTTSVIYISDSLLAVTTPVWPSINETVDIIISNTYGSDTLFHAFRYYPNPPPVFSVSLLNDDTVVMVNTPVNMTFNATDPEGEPVSFRLLEHPDSMTIDSITGNVNWTPLDTGTFQVTIIAFDTLFSCDTFSFHIRTYPNTAPLFYPLYLDTNLIVGHTCSLAIKIIDPDGGEIIPALLEKPESLTFSFLSDTCVLIWTPQISDTGRHLVAIKASDTLGASDTFAFHINVTRFNNTPCIISTPNYTTSALTYWTYFIRAFDPDGDILTCSLAVFPSGMMLSADTVRWYPAKTQAGDFPVTIIVRDNRGKDTSQNFYLHVAESPYPLEFRQWSPVNFDTSIYETDVLNLRVVAWNADSLALFTYWWEVADSEVSNTNMWTFFQTDYESAGLQCTVFAYATDGTDTISAVWHILVKNRAIPPEIVSPSDNDSLWGDSLLSWRIVDPDFDKNTGVYRIELYEDSLFSNKLKTIDSIYDTSATLINLLQQWDIPESSMVYWRVSGKDGSGYSIGYSSTKSRFFFCGLEDIAIERVSSIIPKKYELYQNSPNPFNPMTTIRFAVPKRGSVSIVIHDIQGKLVKKYFFPSLIPGYYSVACNMNNMEGKQYPNGLYAYTLKTNEWTYSRKMLLLK